MVKMKGAASFHPKNGHFTTELSFPLEKEAGGADA
jgi:hypothetical protein